ncbi:unnamed protein product [Blepharisma stoltei]|uniref:Uncharacterized protein n=1 Tax=Blepharisma stoltei TaxID=1481888 RepID=A0AAU9J634_9CILI|nr:unnamed protein product [Blepharisma stoltei]
MSNTKGEEIDQARKLQNENNKDISTKGNSKNSASPTKTSSSDQNTENIKRSIDFLAKLCFPQKTGEEINSSETSINLLESLDAAQLLTKTEEITSNSPEIFLLENDQEENPIDEENYPITEEAEYQNYNVNGLTQEDPSDQKEEDGFYSFISIRDENSMSNDALDVIISKSLVFRDDSPDSAVKQQPNRVKHNNHIKNNLVSPKYANRKQNPKNTQAKEKEEEPQATKNKTVNAAESMAIGQSLYNKGQEFLTNRESKLEKIFSDTYSFKPTINTKSAKILGGIQKDKNELYSDKIKRPKPAPEEEPKEKKKLKLKDFLDRNYAKPLEHVKEKKVVVPKKEEIDEECTFNPKIDGKSKTIGSHRNLYELAAEKKNKLELKMQEAKIQKEKEELKECTFQPITYKDIAKPSPKSKLVAHSFFADPSLNTIS